MPGYEKSRIVGMLEKDLIELTCAICHEIFCEPVVTQCCRQTFCKSCIEEWLKTQNTCPNDRKFLSRDQLIQPPRLVLNLLNNIQIKCKYEGKGCEAIPLIGELSRHLQECDHKPDLNCKTCGLLKIEDQEHNCVESLKMTNLKISNRMERLNKQIDELRNSNPNINLVNSNSICACLFALPFD